MTIEAFTSLASLVVADTNISFARDSIVGLHGLVLPTLVILACSHYGPLVYTLVCESFMLIRLVDLFYEEEVEEETISRFSPCVLYCRVLCVCALARAQALLSPSYFQYLELR